MTPIHTIQDGHYTIEIFCDDDIEDYSEEEQRLIETHQETPIIVKVNSTDITKKIVGFAYFGGISVKSFDDVLLLPELDGIKIMADDHVRYQIDELLKAHVLDFAKRLGLI